MAKKIKQKNTDTVDTRKRRKRIFIICISLFLGAALVFGAVLGIITAVRYSKAVISYDGIVMDEKVASFFVGRFKTQYIHDLRTAGYKSAADTEYFWNSQYDEKNTHGEMMRSLAERKIKQILIDNYLFDSVATLSAEDEAMIEKAIKETLEFHTDGTEEDFNAKAAEYGFDYDSYRIAVEMLYKANKAFAANYGENGALISSNSSFNGGFDRYLNEYSHVKLLFFRTEKKVIKGDDGSETVVELTEKEKEERMALISEIRASIDAFNNGNDGQITPLLFQNYIEKKGEGDPAYSVTGYYFHKDASFTKEFAVQHPSVTEAAMEMSVGEYREVKVDFAGKVDGIAVTEPSPGVCFIYKYEPTGGAYSNTALSGCFSDFYLNMAKDAYLDASERIMPNVEIGPRFESLDFYAIATNSILYPRYDLQ